MRLENKQLSAEEHSGMVWKGGIYYRGKLKLQKNCFCFQILICKTLGSILLEKELERKISGNTMGAKRKKYSIKSEITYPFTDPVPFE